MKNKEIDLGTYRSGGVKVFSGRDRGKKVRDAMDLDNLDKDKDLEITIKVPQDTISMNTSFFLGLFGDSVRTFGESAFKSRFSFSAETAILNSVEQGIERALKETSVL